MANVYLKGVSPVSKDGRKALECYEKGIGLVNVADIKSVFRESTSPYQSMLDYLLLKVLSFDPSLDKFYTT